MLFDPTVPCAISGGPIGDIGIWLWRLMIDYRYQGRGFGRQALDLIVSHARSLDRFDRLFSSYVPGPNGPEEFYLDYGFTKTGTRRNNGIEIALPL